MNLYFNDLTVTRDEGKDLALFTKFAQVFYAFAKVTGEQHVWAPAWVKDYLKNLHWSQANIGLWSWLNAALGLVSRESPRESEDVEERFLASHFTVRLSTGNVPCDQMGLSVLTKPHGARKGMSIGLSVNEEWRRLVYAVDEARDDAITREHLALCLVEATQIAADDIREWCQCGYERRLPVSDIPIQSKRIHLRDDHGRDVLEDLARRLVKSPYVEEVVNSLPFNPHATRFIESAKPNGMIDVRLHKTPQGLGLAIQTTGRDLDATERIARVLQDKFGEG